MEPTPLVSIVIVNYNQTKFATECINSIKKQDYENKEIFFIDNASTDDEEILNDIFSDKTINTIKNKINIGLPAALNAIIPLLKGKYYVFIAADDVMAMNRIRLQVNTLENNSSVLGCSGSQVKINEFGKKIKKQNNIIKEKKIVNLSNYFKKSNFIYSPTLMLRASIFNELNFKYNENIGIEDLYLIWKIIGDGHTFIVTNNVYTYYRIHTNNNHSKYLWMHKNKLSILNEHKNKPYYKNIKKITLLEGFYSLSKKNKRQAFSLLKDVYKYPTHIYFIAGVFNLIFNW